MNFDAVFYHTLTPLALSLRWVAGSLFAAAVIWHWARGSWMGVTQGAHKGWPLWKDALMALLIYSLFYTPLPNPGGYIGFHDDDVDFGQLHYQETTVGIFMLERVAFGVDALVKSILAWDITIKALDQEGETFVSGAAQTLQTSREPNATDVMYSFIILRAQFIKRYSETLWNNSKIREPEGMEEKKGSPLGNWELFKALTSGQRTEYLVDQFTSLIYSLGATLSLIASYLVLTLISLLFMALAGVARFAAIFVMGIFMFLLPFAYFIKGRQALIAGANLTLAYVFLKGSVFLVIWIGFFILEGIVLQGYLEVAADYPHLTSLLQEYRPGYLYTESGSDILFFAEQGIQYQMGVLTIAKTLLSMIVLLLTMVYILLKLPGFISSLLGIQPQSDDIFSSLMFIGGAAGGMALKGKALAGSSTNQITKT